MTQAVVADSPRTAASARKIQGVQPAFQAFLILHAGFSLLPILAGVDKFFHILGNWDQYLAPVVADALAGYGHEFMLVVGVIEIAAGLLVAFRPRIGAYVVAAWLIGIIGNLILAGAFYDVAARDFGLALGALALGRLSEQRWDKTSG